MRKTLVILAFVLVGCAEQKAVSWRRIDGHTANQQQLVADHTVCSGEMQKANLSATMEPGFVIGSQGIYNPKDRAMMQVFDGCMAQRGYMRD